MLQKLKSKFFNGIINKYPILYLFINYHAFIVFSWFLSGENWIFFDCLEHWSQIKNVAFEFFFNKSTLKSTLYIKMIWTLTTIRSHSISLKAQESWKNEIFWETRWCIFVVHQFQGTQRFHALSQKGEKVIHHEKEVKMSSCHLVWSSDFILSSSSSSSSAVFFEFFNIVHITFSNSQAPPCIVFR